MLHRPAYPHLSHFQTWCSDINLRFQCRQAPIHFLLQLLPSSASNYTTRMQSRPSTFRNQQPHCSGATSGDDFVVCSVV